MTESSEQKKNAPSTNEATENGVRLEMLERHALVTTSSPAWEPLPSGDPLRSWHVLPSSQDKAQLPSAV